MGTSAERRACLRAGNVTEWLVMSSALHWMECKVALEYHKIVESQNGRESKMLRLTFRPRMKAGEDWVEYRKKTSWEMRAKWRKMKFPTMAEKNAEKVWKTMVWANF